MVRGAVPNLLHRDPKYVFVVRGSHMVLYAEPSKLFKKYHKVDDKYYKVTRSTQNVIILPFFHHAIFNHYKIIKIPM